MSFTKFIALLLCVGMFGLPLTPTAQANTPVVQQTDQAGSALREGRRLLKRGRADQPRIQLRTALILYTSPKNNTVIAATTNELGDLNWRRGQYPIALDTYQKAL